MTSDAHEPNVDALAEQILSDLRRREAHIVMHGTRSLADHLRGTYDVLAAWRQPSRVCHAGFLHSVYSTDAFEDCLIEVENRGEVRDLIGEESERLVYLFCAIERDKLFDCLRSSGEDARTWRLRDRWTGETLGLSGRDLGDLVVLHMANEAEQGCLPTGAPSHWISHVGELAQWAQRFAEVVPPVLGGCSRFVSREAEASMLTAYECLCRDLSLGAAEPAPETEDTLFRDPIVAEPLVWRALASVKGGLQQAKGLADRAQVLLEQWGVPWDKRLPIAGWRNLIALAGDLASRGDEVPAAEREAIIAVLTRAAGSPDRLHKELAAANLIPPLVSGMEGLSKVLPPRFSQYVASFRLGDSPKEENLYPGIVTQPWHDARRFPIAQALENAAPKILAEFRKLDMRLFQDEAESIPREGRWSVLFLHERDKRRDDICEVCPVTTSVIESHADATRLAGVSYFSCLEPGTRVALHRGPTNTRLRCHLGLEIPAQCGLKVGAIGGVWEEGRCIVFDDSFPHEVWNLSDRRRVVLVVDLWHPDLTGDEVNLLRWVAS